MGDSPTCLMQPLCYASAALSPAETSKSNPIDALGQSVSLGRFTSESLSWEKWSTFSQKRYVEEAERYSQPGSVAEKKAFFEARYKKMAEKKAETTLQEQTNAAAGDSTSNNMDLDMHVEPKEEAWEQMTDSHSVSMLDEAKVHFKEDGDVDASPLALEFPNSTLDSGNPQSQHGTMKNDASAESRKTGNKRSLATKCSKFLKACKNKLQSPITSTPSKLMSEDRVARREKRKDKLDAEKVQNGLPGTKYKVAETQWRKWHLNCCLTAGPLPCDGEEMRRTDDLGTCITPITPVQK